MIEEIRSQLEENKNNYAKLVELTEEQNFKTAQNIQHMFSE